MKHNTFEDVLPGFTLEFQIQNLAFVLSSGKCYVLIEDLPLQGKPDKHINIPFTMTTKSHLKQQVNKINEMKM